MNAMNDAPSDPRAMLDLFLRDQGDDESVQVLDGTSNDHDINEFDGTTPKQIHKVLTYIRDNRLQRTKPWNIVWNLHQMLAVAVAGETQDVADEIPNLFGQVKETP